jgi:hypothetical protein
MSPLTVLKTGDRYPTGLSQNFWKNLRPAPAGNDAIVVLVFIDGFIRSGGVFIDDLGDVLLVFSLVGGVELSPSLFGGLIVFKEKHLNATMRGHGILFFVFLVKGGDLFVCDLDGIQHQYLEGAAEDGVATPTFFIFFIFKEVLLVVLSFGIQVEGVSGSSVVRQKQTGPSPRV